MSLAQTIRYTVIHYGSLPTRHCYVFVIQIVIQYINDPFDAIADGHNHRPLETPKLTFSKFSFSRYVKSKNADTSRRAKLLSETCKIVIFHGVSFKVE